MAVAACGLLSLALGVAPAGSATAGAGAGAGAAGGRTSSSRITSHSVSSCSAGQEQLTFVNSSDYANSEVFGDVVLASGTIAESQLVDSSVPLAGNYTVDTNDPSGHSFSICLNWGASGRLWISLGAPIAGLPTVQPTVSAPYRFGYIEFAYKGADPTVDYSNVNNFDFPLNVQTYASAGGSAPLTSSVFRGNTCQIVNAMHDAVQALGGLADWNQIETTANGGFVRIASPSNGLANSGGYPDMTPYVTALINGLPLVTSGPETGMRGPITVEDYYVGSTPPNPPYTGGVTTSDDGAGWFAYQGYFDPSGNLTLGGTLHGDLQPGGSGNATGLTMTVSEAGLAAGIYDQGSEYTVAGAPAGYLDGNDVYSRIWNDLTGAFDYGYWGSTYGGGVDTQGFFQTWPTGSNTSPAGGQTAFAGRSPSTLPAVTGGIPYNLYASVLSRFSPDYLIPYGENYGAGGTNVSPDIAMPQGGEVRVTLPPDGWDGASGSAQCTTGGGGYAPQSGYQEVASDGGIFNFGDAGFFGSTGSLALNKPVVGMAATPDGKGYWLVASDGGIFNFGDAGFFGSTGSLALNKPVVGMAATPDGKGYWLVASDGGIFNFGDAGFFGSTGSLALNKPVVGMAATPDGKGYWLVASDGGIFNFGDAGFFGSTGSLALNKPVVGMAATPDGKGYWLVASDGGIFNFGDAGFFGSTGSLALNKPVVGMAATPDGKGYWLVASDGGIFNFGDAGFFGSTGSLALNKPVVGMG